MSNINLQCLLGIQCDDFVMIAADQSNSHSIMVMKDDEEKIYKISDRLVMGVIGDSGDTNQFAEYIAKNIQLYKMRNGYELGPTAAANFTRRNLAEYLRSSTPYFVNLLLGGYDKENGPELYFMDYLASSVKVPFAAHGYGGYLSLSIMDRYYKKDATEDEAYVILKQCVKEIHKRLFISLPNFQVTVVTRDGIRMLPVINSESVK
ncbi:proteasome subunit beta type-2 [Galleria mellonella]|uniref:Proteasome subunit beta n=1 Tax=Galleria mellonella TaxID=7137 RepID=A0A6J1WN34_GALME|nr:proteasome subunit beta type-2 [Galleria mellonella]